MIVETDEELFVPENLLFPLRAIDGLEEVEFLARKVEALPMDIVKVRGPADRSFFALRVAAHAVHDPLQNAHILRIARPEEFPVAILSEPVDMEDSWRGAKIALHSDPMPEVISHVVAAKRQHGHRIATNLSGGSGCCCSGLGAHGRSGIDSTGPIER